MIPCNTVIKLSGSLDGDELKNDIAFIFNKAGPDTALSYRFFSGESGIAIGLTSNIPEWQDFAKPMNATDVADFIRDYLESNYEAHKKMEGVEPVAMGEKGYLIDYSDVTGLGEYDFSSRWNTYFVVKPYRLDIPNFSKLKDTL